MTSNILHLYRCNALECPVVSSYRASIRATPSKWNVARSMLSKWALIFMLGSPTAALAEQSSTSINLTFTVPVVCTLVNGTPSCNLILTKVNATTWTSGEFKITLLNGFITIESLN